MGCKNTHSDIFIVWICSYLTSFCIIIIFQKSEEMRKICHTINIFNHILSSFNSSLHVLEIFSFNIRHIYRQNMHWISDLSLLTSCISVAKNRNGPNRKYGKWIELRTEQNESNKIKTTVNRFSPREHNKILLEVTRVFYWWSTWLIMKEGQVF